jgi:cyclopropane-fatty-acyl-phospholipid synthase
MSQGEHTLRPDQPSDFPRHGPLAARLVLGLLARMPRGRLTLRLPDGTCTTLGSGELAASMHVEDWGVFAEALRRGDIGLGETYMARRWSTPDVAALMTLFAANRDAIERAVYGGFWGGMLHRVRHWLNANTRAGSRRNIAAHYDLGNDFYSLWLDPSMTYSAAIFGGDAGRSLEAAQRAKYERILDRLRPRPGDRILEIGCGWGGFMEVAARDYGCHVTGLTLSREQADHARNRMAALGLSGRTAVELVDYRDVEGSYDHVVSIEMYEAVGERYWPAYFATLHDRLKPGASAVIQAITIDDRYFDRYRVGTDFIQQYVFPGGMLASPSRIRAEAERTGLEVSNAYAFGRDYAETLRRWRLAFMDRLPEVRALGHSDAFLRMWEFYLAYCEAGFDTLCTDVYHFQLSRS